jgi:peptide/nickel transport system permease protein
MFILKRLSFYLLTFWAAITMNFLLPHFMPGNAVSAVMARAQGQLPPGALHAIELAFGVKVHESLWAQYGTYLANLLHGDLGISFTYFPEPVSQVIASTLPWTIFLIGLATVFAFIIGNLLGVYAAWRRGRPLADTLPIAFTMMAAMPYFWVALILLYVCGFLLGWFPISHSIGTNVVGWFHSATSVLYHAILPALSIVVTSMGGWMVGMRNNMVSVLSEDYVTLAEMKGLPEREVVTQYAARNALLPAVTGFAMSLGFVVGGAVLTEIVFSYPGIGYALFQAVSNQDYPLMQAIFLIIVTAVLVANFLVDILYSRLDPRVQTGA